MKLAWLAGAATAALVVVAAVDAVRRDDPPAPPATTELEDRPALASQAAQLGFRGELLLYGDGCSVEVLELPSLEREPLEGVCSPRGTRSPDGELVAVCRGEETQVFYTAEGGLQNGFPGCPPAWRPDGTLTLSRNRQVVSERGRLLVGRRELERAARRHPTTPALAPLRVLIDGIAWLSNTRAAVLLSIRLAGRFEGMGPLSAIVFFENGLAEDTQPYFRQTGGPLAASPLGTYVTLTPDVILRADGSRVSLPPHIRDSRAMAWSNDERFLAIASRFGIHLLDVASLERYDEIGSGLRSITIPQPALDLAWR